MPTKSKSTKIDNDNYLNWLFGNIKSSTTKTEKKKKTIATKKKAKIVNQKAGSNIKWTFCVNLRNYFPNVFTADYMEYQIISDATNVTIQKNTGIFGYGKSTYSISNKDGEILDLGMNEEEFIYMLLGKDIKSKDILYNLGYYNNSPTEEKPDYKKNLCILYHIAFFEDCIPIEFQDLHKIILIQIRNSFLFFKNSKESELERIKRRIYFGQPLNNYEILMLDFCSQPHVTVMSDMQMCAEKLKDSSIKLCLKIEDKPCKRIVLNSSGKKLYEYNNAK
jgi:hypothetical protein